ncbi:unnamed protein product, partial [Mycena citricolor]
MLENPGNCFESCEITRAACTISVNELRPTQMVEMPMINQDNEIASTGRRFSLRCQETVQSCPGHHHVHRIDRCVKRCRATIAAVLFLSRQNSLVVPKAARDDTQHHLRRAPIRDDTLHKRDPVWVLPRPVEQCVAARFSVGRCDGRCLDDFRLVECEHRVRRWVARVVYPDNKRHMVSRIARGEVMEERRVAFADGLCFSLCDDLSTQNRRRDRGDTPSRSCCLS